jgi:hypothetical protein
MIYYYIETNNARMLKEIEKQIPGIFGIEERFTLRFCRDWFRNRYLIIPNPIANQKAVGLCGLEGRYINTISDEWKQKILNSK